MTWRAGLPASLGPSGYSPQMLRMRAESRWTPRALAPTALLDARYGVTAKVPVAVASSSGTGAFGKASPNGFTDLAAITVVSMARMLSSTSNQKFLQRFDNGEGGDRQFRLGCSDPGGGDRFEFYTQNASSSAVTAGIARATLTPAIDTAYFLAGRYDGAEVKLRVVAGGTTYDATPAAQTGDLKNPTSTDPVSSFSGFRNSGYGVTDDNDGELFYGAIWSRALSDDELVTLYNSGTQITWDDLDASLQSGCILWWEYSPTSTGFTDRSGNSNSPTSTTGVTYKQGSLDAISLQRSGTVSQLDDPRGASIFSGVQATASRQPKWVYNSGQSYLEALGITSKLSDSSTGATINYNTPRTLGGIFYYPAAATGDGVFIGTAEGVGHTTSIGAISNTVLQFAASTTNTTNGILVRKTVSNRQGLWFTWFATFDGTDADGVRLYLNAVLQTSLTVTWNTLSSGTAGASSVQIIGIGAGNALAGMRHAGSILDTKVWSQADITRYHRWAKRRNPSYGLA